MDLELKNVTQRLVNVCFALFLLCGASAVASARENYTGNHTPGQYVPLDPTFAGAYLGQLNEQLQQGLISYEEYEQAMTQASKGARPSERRQRPPRAPQGNSLNTPSTPATPRPSGSNTCDNITGCGACFLTANNSWDNSRCVPGDPSVFLGCDFKACGAVSDGYACGTSQPGPSGYDWPCKSGSVCAGPSPGGNFTGVCRPASEAGQLAGTAFMSGFDTAKLNNPAHKTPKYIFARTVLELGLSASASRDHLQPLVDVLRQRGLPNAKVAGDDKIDFGKGVGVVDVITRDGVWWWGPESSLENDSAAAVSASSPFMEGFDTAKLNNPAHKTTKYIFGRTVQELGVSGSSSRDHLQPLVDALRQKGLTDAKVVGDDKIDFGAGVGVVDVITSKGTWWWGTP